MAERAGPADVHDECDSQAVAASMDKETLMTTVGENPLSTQATELRHIARFERRARVHTFLAAIVLLLIAILLGFAGYVFFRAASITLDDFSKDRSIIELENDSIDMLVGSEEIARDLRDLYVKKFEVGQVELLDVLWAETELMAARRRLSIAVTRADSGRPIGTDLYWPDPRSRSELNVTIELLEFHIKQVELIFSQLTDLDASGRGDEVDVATGQKWLQEAKLELNLFMSQERQAKDDDALSLELQEYSITGYAPLIQTSVTRFGTMIVIFFFISILVPLYRYNVRLRVFYYSLADALLLSQKHADLSFADLAPILSPAWGFDAPPETPTAQSAQFLERIAGAAVKKS